MEFHGEDTNTALRAALGVRSRKELQKRQREQKGNASVSVSPGEWSNWIEVFSQFGVVGPGKDQKVKRVRISFKIVSGLAGSFDVEVRGGDSPIRTTGPWPVTTTITGNVATSIRVRLKAHSVPLAVFISAY